MIVKQWPETAMDFESVHVLHVNWDSSNLPDAWKKFRQHAELMLSGTLNEKSEEETCSYLLIWLGEKGRHIYNTWTYLTDKNQKKFKTYYVKFITPKCYTKVLIQFTQGIHFITKFKDSINL